MPPAAAPAEPIVVRKTRAKPPKGGLTEVQRKEELDLAARSGKLHPQWVREIIEMFPPEATMAFVVGKASYTLLAADKRHAEQGRCLAHAEQLLHLKCHVVANHS